MSSGEHISSDKALFFLQGGGELGALMRTRDWTGSPLGPPSSWPQPLRSVVGLLLTSKFPMFVAWGPELGFLYNDAYAEILGAKHPRALGARFRDIWEEIWPDIQPLIASALRGEATYRENLPLVMSRGRGFAEQAWFTFSYSPVRDETGAVMGMFCAVAETTAQVRSQARQAFRIAFEETIHELEAPTEVMAAAARALGRSLGVDRVGYGEIDEHQDIVTIERDWTSGRLPSLTGRLRLGDFGPALVREVSEGRTVCLEDVETDPRVGDRVSSYAAIGTRSVLAVPLLKAGQLVALLFLHHSEPRKWSEDDIGLVKEVADRTWATVERARAEAQKEELFRALVENLPELAWSAQPDGSIDYFNRRWYEYTGTTFEEVRGWGWQKLHAPETLPEVLRRLRHSIATGEPFEMEFPMRGADGVFRWFLTRMQPLRDSHGEITRWFGTNTNVDEQRRQATALKEAIEARDIFLSVASHELKTPLTPMALRLQGLSRALDQQASSLFVQQVRSYTESAKRQIDKLAALVNDLLDVSRISSRRFRMELEPTDLAALARDVVARFEPEAQRAGSTLELHAPPTLMARSAKLRVEQVLTNLVDNAIKYGAGAPISVTLERDGELARLIVVDQGIGVEPENLSRIFERFERAVSERNYGGLGLGLYISRTIVESLGGTIQLRSTPGRGATFIVELPLQPEPGKHVLSPS